MVVEDEAKDAEEFTTGKKCCIVCGDEAENGRYCPYHQKQSDKAKKLREEAE